MMMLVRFSGCCFKLNFYLMSWSEFISFDRYNCFSQCVSIVGSQFNFFHCLISCLHLCLLNFKFPSHFANRQHFHFMRHSQIGRFSFHDWKRENFSIVIWTVIVFYWYFEWHFTLGLSYGWKDFLNFAYSYFDCATWFLFNW